MSSRIIPEESHRTRKKLIISKLRISLEFDIRFSFLISYIYIFTQYLNLNFSLKGERRRIKVSSKVNLDMEKLRFDQAYAGRRHCWDDSSSQLIATTECRPELKISEVAKRRIKIVSQGCYGIMNSKSDCDYLFSSHARGCVIMTLFNHTRKEAYMAHIDIPDTFIFPSPDEFSLEGKVEARLFSMFDCFYKLRSRNIRLVEMQFEHPEESTFYGASAIINKSGIVSTLKHSYIFERKFDTASDGELIKKVPDDFIIVL